jgi:spore coat polysaccharide biosynthesis protein SpsF (cytidylyltransferase family)
MTTGILITARLGSSRLPEKHLREIGGWPALHYLLERTVRHFSDEIVRGRIRVVLATSTDGGNRRLREVQPSVDVFFGDDRHIPRRHLQAALTHAFDAIVSVDGDDILCSPWAMRQVWNELRSGALRAQTDGLPLGMNAWGYTTEVLQHVIDPNDYGACDTGWGRLFEDIPPTTRSRTLHRPSASSDPTDFRLTLDYPEDLAFFRALIDRLGPGVYEADDQAIVDTIARHGLADINAGVRDVYWTTFEEERAEQCESSSRSVTESS